MPSQVHKLQHVSCFSPWTDALQELVETAMLSAVSGLMYLMTATIGLDRYIGYFLPLPVLIAAVKRGKSATWWTTCATACLIAGVTLCSTRLGCLVHPFPAHDRPHRTCETYTVVSNVISKIYSS